TLSLLDALPVWGGRGERPDRRRFCGRARLPGRGGRVYSPAMTRRFDVLVIGGGAAGVAAALAAAGRGARAGLVRPGPGVTAMAGGGWAGARPDPRAAAPAGAGPRLGCGPVRVPR